jgi:hypothetical protein
VYLDGVMELHLVYCAMDMVANGFKKMWYVWMGYLACGYKLFECFCVTRISEFFYVLCYLTLSDLSITKSIFRLKVVLT